MTCNNCKYFSIRELKTSVKYANNRDYYSILLLKCKDLNIILEAVGRDAGLKDVEIPDILPIWDCPRLQELRKKDKIPHFELTILNGYTNNNFNEWIKIN